MLICVRMKSHEVHMIHDVSDYMAIYQTDNDESGFMCIVLRVDIQQPGSSSTTPLLKHWSSGVR